MTQPNASYPTRRWIHVHGPVTREDRAALVRDEAIERWVYEHTRPKDAPSWRVFVAQDEAAESLRVARRGGGVGWKAIQDAEAARRR